MSSRGVLPVRRVCLLKCRHLLSPPPLRGRDGEGGSRVRQSHPLRLRCDPPPFAPKRGRAPPQGGSGEHVATLQKHPPRERASPKGGMNRSPASLRTGGAEAPLPAVRLA